MMSLAATRRELLAAFFGAYNYVFAAPHDESPNIQIVLTTPISLFLPAVAAGLVDSLEDGWDNVIAVREALLTLAVHHKLPIMD